MKTKLWITAINYNTPDFLCVRLEELRTSHIISFWAFMRHHAEEDELKDHNHVFIIPSRSLLTDDIIDHCKEFDPSHPDKPLTFSPIFRIVKERNFGDWYYYSLHDPVYLRTKGESRAYHYRVSEFYTSDHDALNELALTIRPEELSAYTDIAANVANGVPFERYVQIANVPIQHYMAYRTVYSDLMYALRRDLDRNGRTTHTPRIAGGQGGESPDSE